MYVRGDFKADSVKQTEPGHKRIERWRETQKDSLGEEIKGIQTGKRTVKRKWVMLNKK